MWNYCPQTPSRPRWSLFRVALCALTVTLAGCTYGISVREEKIPPLVRAWRDSAVNGDELSPRTTQTLRQLDLTTLYHRHPDQALAKLHDMTLQNPQPDLLFALAEVSYHIGLKTEVHACPKAISYYYLCAGYAYHFLFDRPPADGRLQTADARSAEINLQSAIGNLQSEDAFDPRFRLACDLYNNGLAKCIRAAQRVGRLDASQTLVLPTAKGDKFTLSVVHHGFAWRPEEFGPLLFCSDYQVVGLQNHYRGYGLGVPLIGVRAASAAAAPVPGSAFYPGEVSFPVTAFFRFEGSLADLGARQVGRLELYNPLAIQKIKVEGRPVPLETDLTTPLAYFLGRSDLEGIEYKAFLRSDSLRPRQGIYMFEPYQPGKIPVLMVHGLLGSPLTWAPLFNDLRADPVLNEKYQFWFYLYPTGDPYLTTAADLRLALDRLRFEVDPQRRDASLDQMVLVGHSMGGLVSKLLTVDSGSDFWNLMSKQPFEKLKAKQENREALQRIFFFEQESSIKRVIFLATPHHGSRLSRATAVRLLARFIQLPRKLMALTEDVAREDPEFWKGPGGQQRPPHLPTSLDMLSTGAPALELLAARLPPPGMHYHSIIGVCHGQGENGSDGAVPYNSAHIDGIDSEIVVPAEHSSVHHHPRAVLEVRRILYEHLRAVEAGNGTIVPVGAQIPVPSGAPAE